MDDVEEEFENGFIYEDRFISYLSLYPRILTNFTLTKKELVKCDEIIDEELENVD